jgi:hypothetical protein
VDQRTVSITLGTNGTADTTYTCGQYANGDYWIEGKGANRGVEVVSTSPAKETNPYSPVVGGTCPEGTNGASWWRNGWGINPEYPGDHHADGRRVHCGHGNTEPLLPVYETGDGPISFYKAAGNDVNDCTGGPNNPPCSNNCVDFLGIWTFVDSAAGPCGGATAYNCADSDNDGFTADEFRPAPAGVAQEKPGPFTIDGDGAGTFVARAQAMAVHPQATIANMPVSDLPSGADMLADWTFAQIKKRYRWPFFLVSSKAHLPNPTPGPNYMYAMPALIFKYGHYLWNGVYGANRRRENLSSALRFLLDDFSFPNGTDDVRPCQGVSACTPGGPTVTRDEDEQALINFVQSGIDTYATLLIGQTYCVGNTWIHNTTAPQYGDTTVGGTGNNYWSPIDPMNSCYGYGFGSIPNGPKVRVMYAAHLLDDPQMKATVAGTADMDVIKADNAPAPDSEGNRRDRVAEHFTSDGEIYTGLDGRPYYGGRFAEHLCRSVPVTNVITVSRFPNVARHPDMKGDPPCDCTNNIVQYDAYLGQNANQLPYWSVIVKSLGLRGLFNNDPLLDFAYGWMEGDPHRGLPVGGYTHIKGIYCPQNPLPWMTPAACGPANDYLNCLGNHIGYRSSFGRAMWRQFKDYIATPDVLSLHVTTDKTSGDCSGAGFDVDVTGNTDGSCPAGDNVDWYLHCPGETAGSFDHSALNSADTTSHDFVDDCTITSAVESDDIIVRVDCPHTVATNTQTVNVGVSCAAVDPQVTRVDLIELTDPPSVVQEFVVAGTNPCYLTLGDGEYCDPANCGPCNASEGDCDGDAECVSGTTCSSNVGADYGWASTIDVCEKPTPCTEALGHGDYCELCGPCAESQGDCDPGQCDTGLVLCASDVGASYGWASTIDVCEQPNLIDKAQLGECYALHAKVNADTESVSWDYLPPSGTPSVSPHDDDDEPFCLSGDTNTWYDQPGGTPSCTCTDTTPGDLSEVGVHEVTSITPYESDGQVGAGTAFGTFYFSVSDSAPPTLYNSCSAE